MKPDVSLAMNMCAFQGKNRLRFTLTRPVCIRWPQIFPRCQPSMAATWPLAWGRAAPGRGCPAPAGGWVPGKASPRPHHRGLGEKDLSPCHAGGNEAGAWQPGSAQVAAILARAQRKEDGGQPPLCSPLPAAKREMTRNKASGAAGADVLHLHKIVLKIVKIVTFTRFTFTFTRLS